MLPILCVGDVMYDATLLYRDIARERHALDAWGVREGDYVLSTVHRAENTDDAARFGEIWGGLERIASVLPVVLPVHPRTRKLFPDLVQGAHAKGILVTEPVSYLEMMRLEMSARAIITDSGGVQKEAYFHRVPCLTVRDETEWVETVTLGWNILCGADRTRMWDAWERLGSTPRSDGVSPYGDGRASEAIVRRLVGDLR